jgi:hypothetical protein
MRRVLFLALTIAAASVLAGPSFGKQAEPASSSAALPAVELRALDSRLIPVVLSGQRQGGGAALVTARSQGLLVAQGKVRVLVQARMGHVTGARTAVRLASGTVVIATGKLIEALVPPKSLRGLALSKHVISVRPVEAAASTTVTGLRMGPLERAKAAPAGALFGVLSFDDATVPGEPTDVAAQAGDGQATITFTPPASNGGDGILYYTVTAYPGGQTASGTEGSITVTGLTNGDEYVFTVRATNGMGVGPESGPSNTVTPEGTSRLSPELPAEGARPDIPTFSPRSSPRVKPVRNVGEF